MDTKESDNYLKTAYIVIEIISEALRAVFKTEWDGCFPAIPWNDDPASLANFKAKAIPHGSPPMSQAWKNYNSLTNGDRKQWDITMLGYVLIFSKPLKLQLKKPLTHGAVDSLRRIRNKVLHKEKAELTDADFKSVCNDIENELKTFGPTCQIHLNEVKTIRNKIFSKEVIEKLMKEREKAIHEYLVQKRWKNFLNCMVACLLILMGVLVHSFVPPKVHSYFPQDITAKAVGRQEEIKTGVDTFLAGTRIIEIYGPQGVGKRTTALAIGQQLLSNWIPFPWISVTYVNLNGITDISQIQRRILESFFVYTESDVSYHLKDLISNKIKRKTVVILDRVHVIFDSKIKLDAKEFVIDMLDWNKNIALLFILSEPVYTPKFIVKTIGLKPLNYVDSVSLLKAVTYKNIGDAEDVVVRFCHGIPFLLKLFGEVIKDNDAMTEMIIAEVVEQTPIGKYNVVDEEHIKKSARTLIEKLDKTHQEILTFMSFSKDSFSLETIEDIFVNSDKIISGLLSMGLLERVGVNKQNIRYAAKLYDICDSLKNERSHLCEELRLKFVKHYISVASRLGSSFFDRNFKMETIFRKFVEEEHNINVMLEIAKQYTQVYDAIYDMLLKMSAFCTFEFQQNFFTCFVYYHYAFYFKENDISKFFSLLYAQSDHGDIHSFFHNRPNEFVIHKSLEELMKEPECTTDKSSRESGICLLLYGREVALNLTTDLKAKRSEILSNTNRGIELVEKAIDMFTELHLKQEQAEALTCKGLILMTTGNLTQSVEAFKQSSEILKELYGNHPFVASSYFNVAVSYYKMGDFHLLKAITLFNSSFTMFENTIGAHRRTANALFYIGTSLQYLGKYDEAKTSLSKAYSIQNEVTVYHTDLTKAPRDKAESLYMNYLVDKATQTAEMQLEKWSIPDEINMRSTFIAYFIANCQKSLGKEEAAFESYNAAKQKLFVTCENNTAGCEILSILMEDIQLSKTQMRQRMHTAEKTYLEADFSFVVDMLGIVAFCLFYACVVLIITVLFAYIFLRFANFLDFFNGF